MFAPPPLYVRRTPEQMERYTSVLAALRRLECDTRDSDDPVVFHGTTLISASHIVQDGFTNSHIQPGAQTEDVFGFKPGPNNTGTLDGVHWGTLNVAASFAKKFVTTCSDDHPVFLMARISDLKSVARIYPDWFCINDASQPVCPYDDVSYDTVPDEDND